MSPVQTWLGAVGVKLRCTRSGAMGRWCLLSVVTTVRPSSAPWTHWDDLTNQLGPGRCYLRLGVRHSPSDACTAQPAVGFESEPDHDDFWVMCWLKNALDFDRLALRLSAPATTLMARALLCCRRSKNKHLGLRRQNQRRSFIGGYIPYSPFCLLSAQPKKIKINW
jgi:hypothetical protein